MPTPVVIDLSHHNVVPDSLQAAKDAGIVGLIHKATEGLTFYDDKCEARRWLAKDVGMAWGVYHFIRAGNIVDQVAFFLDEVAGLVDDETLFALDYEDPDVSLEDVATFLSVLADERTLSATKRSPVLYSGHVLKDKIAAGEDASALTGYRLWLAQYGSAAVLPPGWDRYWLWQYSDQGKVPGIDPPTDVNAYDGPVSKLLAGWSGIAAPEPEPEPIEITITLEVESPVPVKVIVKQADSE